MKSWILNLDHHEVKKVPHTAGEVLTQLSAVTFIPAADLSIVPKSSVAIVSLIVKTPVGESEVPIAVFSALKAQTVKLDLRFLMEEVSVSVRYRQGKPSGSIILSGAAGSLV